MNSHSKRTIGLADHIVFVYSSYDPVAGCYTFDKEDEPGQSLVELAESMLADDEGFAAEATGPDNPSYYTLMMPALRKYLRKSYDEDRRIEFMSAWKSGVVDYCRRSMMKLLDERLEAYNEEKGCHTSLIWDRVSERTVEVRI
jgi:hypothetical protein